MHGLLTSWIHYQLNTLVEQILESLKADSVSRDKVNFVDYLVRNFIALKFAYLRDLTLLRNKTINIEATPVHKSYAINLN
jgi:hypothetical protein